MHDIFLLGQLQIKHCRLNIYIYFYFLLDSHKMTVTILFENAHAQHSLFHFSALYYSP